MTVSLIEYVFSLDARGILQKMPLSSTRDTQWTSEGERERNNKLMKLKLFSFWGEGNCN